MPLKTYYLSETIPFGKYKNTKLIDIMNKDLDYVTWALGNISEFALASTAKELYNFRLRNRDKTKEAADLTLVGKLDIIVNNTLELPKNVKKKLKDEDQLVLTFGDE